MGFWDNLGKVAGTMVSKGVDEFKKAAMEVRELKEEMQYYGEDDLVSIYKDARRRGKFKECTAAKAVLKEKYDYEDWQFENVDFL